MRLARVHLAVLSLCAVMLAGCQGVSGPLTYAQVRFIHVSSDSPALDVYQNGSPLLYSFSFGTSSSYIPISPGASVVSVHTAGLHQQLGSAGATLLGGGQYTALIGDNAAAQQVTILKDQATAAPAGQFALRVIDQATRMGPVDVYLLPPGARLAETQPIVTGLSFSNSAAYLNLPSGTYSLIAVPTGTPPAASLVPLLTGSQVEYPSGAARTVILIDSTQSSPPTLQDIVVSDFN